jgi:hypothetical protein
MHGETATTLLLSMRNNYVVVTIVEHDSIVFESPDMLNHLMSFLPGNSIFTAWWSMHPLYTPSWRRIWKPFTLKKSPNICILE